MNDGPFPLRQAKDLVQQPQVLRGNGHDRAGLLVLGAQFRQEFGVMPGKVRSDEPLDDIGHTARAAEACTWFSFHAVGDWFYDVAWDFGLIAVRPGGNTLAVLAATDTD